MEEFFKLDLYDILGVLPSAEEKEVILLILKFIMVCRLMAKTSFYF